MPLPRGLPIVDHHCHLSPNGEGVEAARRFRAAGGSHLFLTTQNYTASVPRSVEDYRKQFETTEQLGQRVQEETGVRVYDVVAPYPVDLVHAIPALGSETAVAVHRAALDLAGTWVREGRALAIGEVGRAHFPVSAEVGDLVEEAFRHAFEVARDVGCPMVVHSEDLDAAGYHGIAELARRAGVPPEHVVKHYARSQVPPPAREGIVPSYLAQRDLTRQAMGEPGPWFLETDFLDDPARPGAVLDLATVPRRARTITEGSPDGGERLLIPFVESVEKVYGVRPERPERDSV